MLFTAFAVACALGCVAAIPEMRSVPYVRLNEDSKFGVHIFNVNIENISNEEFDLVHENLLLHRVVIVRNQGNLTVEGQRKYAQRFGPLHVHLESSSHYPGYTDVNVVSNIKNEKGSYIGLFGMHVETFHSDLSW
jgi:taurine dioxygenase